MEVDPTQTESIYKMKNNGKETNCLYLQNRIIYLEKTFFQLLELMSSLSEYIIKTLKYNFFKITRTMCKTMNLTINMQNLYNIKLQIVVRIIECVRPCTS